MITETIENSKLQDCINIYNEMKELKKEYENQKDYLKTRLASAVKKAKFDEDLSVATIADNLGITRQYLNSILIDNYGVQHPEKAAAAKIGHKAKAE